MQVNQFISRLRILLRAELLLFKAEANRRTNRVMLLAVALACFLVALIFVNFGAFFYLTGAAAQAKAALILAAVNIGISLIPILLARGSKPGPEEDMVRDIREMALDEINRDVEALSKDVNEISSQVKGIRQGFASFGTSGLSSIGALLPLLINLLKKK